MNVPVDEGLHRRVRAAMALEGKRLYEFVDDALRAEVDRVEEKHGISRGIERSEPGQPSRQPSTPDGSSG